MISSILRVIYGHKTIDGIHMLTIAYLHHNEMNEHSKITFLKWHLLTCSCEPNRWAKYRESIIVN